VGLGKWRFRRGRNDQSFAGLQGEIFSYRENLRVYGWQAVQPPCPLVHDKISIFSCFFFLAQNLGHPPKPVQ
jgi:hypothetical protein